MRVPEINDPGHLDAGEVALLSDLYELTMAASYHREAINRPAVFELFVRELPPHRSWLVAAGIGPTLRLIAGMRFGVEQCAYLCELSFEAEFCEYLTSFRFSGEVARSSLRAAGHSASPA